MAKKTFGDRVECIIIAMLLGVAFMVIYIWLYQQLTVYEAMR